MKTKSPLAIGFTVAGIFGLFILFFLCYTLPFNSSEVINTGTQTSSSVDTVAKQKPHYNGPTVLKNLNCHDTKHDCVIVYTDPTTKKKSKVEVRQFWLNNTKLYGQSGRPASFQYWITYFVPKSYDLKKAKLAEDGYGYNLSFLNVGTVKRTYKKGQERFEYGIREDIKGRTDTVPADEGYILLL